MNKLLKYLFVSKKTKSVILLILRLVVELEKKMNYVSFCDLI